MAVTLVGTPALGELLGHPQLEVGLHVLLELAQVVGVDRQHQRRPVVDEHPALGVEDAAAGRLLGHRADAVGRGRGREPCPTMTWRYQRRAKSAQNSESTTTARMLSLRRGESGSMAASSCSTSRATGARGHGAVIAAPPSSPAPPGPSASAGSRGPIRIALKTATTSMTVSRWRSIRPDRPTTSDATT